MADKEFLKNILMEKDVYSSITKNINKLINIIPEIKPCINFKHNNPAHYLDVWEHILKAISLSKNNFDVRLTLLLHDIGKPLCATVGKDGFLHYFGHQKISAEIAENVLTRLHFKKSYINKICYLVEKHDDKISDEELIKNLKLEKIRLEIQRCDSLAHAPKQAEFRMNYILERKNYIKNIMKQTNKR